MTGAVAVSTESYRKELVFCPPSMIDVKILDPKLDLKHLCSFLSFLAFTSKTPFGLRHTRNPLTIGVISPIFPHYYVHIQTSKNDICGFILEISAESLKHGCSPILFAILKQLSMHTNCLNLSFMRRFQNIYCVCQIFLKKHKIMRISRILDFENGFG